MLTGAAEPGLRAANPGAAGALGCGWAGTGAALLFLPPPLEALSGCCQRSASNCCCNSRASASSLDTSASGCAGAAAEESCCGDPLNDFRVHRTLRPSPQIGEHVSTGCDPCDMQQCDQCIVCARLCCAHPRETQVHVLQWCPAVPMAWLVDLSRMRTAQAPAAAAPVLPTPRGPASAYSYSIL